MAGDFPDSPCLSVPLCFPPLHLVVTSVYRTVLHHSSSGDYSSPPFLLAGTTLLGTYPEQTLPFTNCVLSLKAFIFDSWSLKVGPIVCPETSVRNYHYSLRM